MKLLNPGAAEGTVKRYVQEQTITTLAMVADASEGTFAKVGGVVFLAIAVGADVVELALALPVDHAVVAERPEECGRTGP